MIPRLFCDCLLGPNDVAPSCDDLEVIGVFNPGAVAIGDEVVLMVRVAERPRRRRPGLTALPRWDGRHGVTADWVPDRELHLRDPRLVYRKRDGLARTTSLSHFRIVRSRDGRTLEQRASSRFVPETEYEEFGVEDPRITRIDEVFYITYVAVSRHGAATALASTTDFRDFQRHGIIFPTENKDVVLFPDRIGGDYIALHRPNGATPFTMPEIWLARSPDLIHWGRHEYLLGGLGTWGTSRVGAGTPPIRTPAGWLEIHHGNFKPPGHEGVGVYCAGAILLDPDEPHRIIRRSTEPLLVPQTDFEREGFVPDVVFPTALVERGDELWVYYGAADSATAVVGFSTDDVLAAIS